MKPLPERLNEQLDNHIAFWNGGKLREPPLPDTNGDPDVDELVRLAHRLQSAPSLQVEPNFARRLEGRLLVHNAALRQKQATVPWWTWLVLRPLRMHAVFTAALLCMLLLGTGVLAMAAQDSNPNNPLYTVKRWEQGMQLTFTHSSADRVTLNLQIARERLNELAMLADQEHGEAYHQALIGFDQQLQTISQAIRALPMESDRDRFSNELATLKADARRSLRKLLPQLALSEQLATTDELGRLGDTIPYLKGATIVLSARPKKQATISIIGDNLQPGAQLLIDNQLIQSSGSLQDGTEVFVINWTGEQSPQTVGILNPDGTVAQTIAITFVSPNEDNTNGSNTNSKGGGNGHGHGSGGGKPSGTPSSHN